MLSTLSIRNILLIDQLDLEFSDGLNVLTGETGAGKSILLDALGFVLGWRGRADLVRQGKPQGEVIASFELPEGHAVFETLRGLELPFEDGQILLRRTVNAEGRKRGFVNDRAVGAEALREIGDQLVESHGQHDDKGLLDEKSHRKMLDEFGGITLEEMKARYQSWQSALKALQQFEEDAANAARDADFVRHAVEELEQIDVQKGETETLDQTRRLMQKGQKLAGEISELIALLGSDDLAQNLREALRRAQNLSAQFDHETDGLLEALEISYDRLADAEARVTSLGDALEFDPIRLEQTEERLFAIRALERKYQIAADELPELLKNYQTRLESLDDQGGLAKKLQANLDATRIAALECANNIHEKRVLASKNLDQKVEEELAPLKMERANFNTDISLQEISATGVDDVRFVVRTNPGAPAGPLSKIASGGELSRFLLALKLSLNTDQARSMLFDEIDRGVGGQTADAVGRRLKRLSQRQQLIIVTHSPQVAAMGERHFMVEKTQSQTGTKTDVRALGNEARIDEIARMISGDQISQEAIAAARKLLEEAHV